MHRHYSHPLISGGPHVCVNTTVYNWFNYINQICTCGATLYHGKPLDFNVPLWQVMDMNIIHVMLDRINPWVWLNQMGVNCTPWQTGSLPTIKVTEIQQLPPSIMNPSVQISLVYETQYKLKFMQPILMYVHELMFSPISEKGVCIYILSLSILYIYI